MALNATVTLLLVACGHAQTTTAVTFTSTSKHVTVPEGMMLTLRTLSSEVHGDMPVVPPDRFFETLLDKKIDGKKCQAGDPVQLTLVYPVTFEIGGKQVRIPEHASITGHVLFVSGRDAQHPSARLAIVADTVEWGGQHMLLPAIVTSASMPTNAGREELHPDHHDTGRPMSAASILGEARAKKGPY